MRDAESRAAAPATEQHDLGHRVRRGIGWKVFSQVSIQLLGFATAVVVARFLTPREIGLVAMALVFSNLVLVVTDAGIASALIQRPELSEDDRSTAFWMSVVLGLVMTLVGVALSWPLARLYGEPKVQVLFAVISPAFFFTALGIVQGALLTRELEFRKLEIRTVAATAASTLATMALAAAGVGVWALVAQSLTVTGVSTALLWRSSDWRPSRRFSTASLRELAAYGKHVLGARMITWARSNVDNLLIGRYVGASRLGAYSIAFNLMVTPVTRLASPITQVFFPAFSRMRDPARIGEVWLRAVRIVASVVVPSMLGLVVVAPDFVSVIFGRRWHEAVPVLQILAPVGMVQALQALNFGILQSLGSVRTLFRYTLFASAGAIGAFAAGLHWGIEGVATAYALASVVLEPAYLIITTRAVGMPIRAWLSSVSGVLQAGIGMMAVIIPLREVLLRAELATDLRLGAVVLGGGCVYLLLLWWRSPAVLEEIRELRRRRVSHRG